jgi:hypothetical protein
MNIINMIKEQLSGDVIERIASYIGEDESKTRTAVNAAVPAILGGLSKLASTGDGARKLSDLFASFAERGPTAGFGLGTEGAAEVEGGLGSLFRDGPLAGIINSLSRFCGLGSGTMRKIMAYISPLVLGTITRSLGKNFTADGISRFFSEQKSNIVDALPSGLSLDDTLGAVGRQGARAVRGVRDAAAEPLRTARAPSIGWPLALTAALLLGLGLWYLSTLARSRGRVTTPPVTERRVEDRPVQTVRDPAIAATDVSDNLHSSMEPLYETLREVKDVGAVADVLPRLRDATERLDQVKQRFDLLPTTRRDSIRETLSSRMTSIKNEIARILAIPNLSEEESRVLRRLSERITGFGWE